MHPTQKQLPSNWLRRFALTAATLGAGVCWLTGGDAQTRPAGAPRTRLAAGPWGIAEVTPLALRPTLDSIHPEAIRTKPMTWFFPGWSKDEARAFLEKAGCDVASASPAFRREASGIWMAPTHDWIIALPAEARSIVYAHLARDERNPTHRYPFTFRSERLDRELAASGLSAATADLVRRLIWLKGDSWMLADTDLILERCMDRSEKQRFLRLLTTHSAVSLRLSLPRSADLEAAVRYWGAGSRTPTARALLEALQDSAGRSSLDIAYLLPPLARNLLLTYPDAGASDRPHAAYRNCFWTALNFFLPRPDDRFVELAAANEALDRSYKLVTDAKQFGDVLVWRDSDGQLMHMAVWMAADVVFTKNGYDALHPWTLMTISELNSRFPFRSADSPTCHRRR